jgi:hypothetical protein
MRQLTDEELIGYVDESDLIYDLLPAHDLGVSEAFESAIHIVAHTRRYRDLKGTQKTNLECVRSELIRLIKPLIPPDKTYLGLWVRHCATIHHLEGSRVVYTGPIYVGQLQPPTIDQMPIESLFDLHAALQMLEESKE